MNTAGPARPGTESTVHDFVLCVGADHPCLPGHFPGAPVVPAVVLLDEVIAAAEAWLDGVLDLAQLQQAKFSTPVLPGQALAVRLQRDPAGTLAFTIGDAARPHARGVFVLRGATAR